MAYALKELYDAIASSGKTLGRFTVSNELEFGSGSVFFFATEGKYRQVYASPAWEQFDCGFGEEIIKLNSNVASFIALQLEEFDESGEYVGPNIPDDLPFMLSGSLEKDLENYFEVLGLFLKDLE